MGAASSKEEEFLDALSGQPVPETPAGKKGPPTSRLYRRVGRGSPSTARGGAPTYTGTWVLATDGVKWKFVQGSGRDDKDEDSEEEEEDRFEDARGEDTSKDDWFLDIPGWVHVRITSNLEFKFSDQHRRVDFFSLKKGPLALKLPSVAEYQSFGQQYMKCLFENTHKVEYTEENLNKVMGKDYAKSWGHAEDSDEVMWDADDSFEEEQRKKKADSAATIADFKESLKAQQSPLGLAMGALENSFLLHSSGIDVFKNEQDHIQSKGTTINFGAAVTPRKGLLIRGETGMLLMSPGQKDKVHSSGLKQVDLEQERVVAEWKFEKDGTAIDMRDVTNDNKSAQLDANRATFLGLDDNRLCRWDMRDKHGVVQTLADTGKSPALAWDDGHQFSRGTNFTCFATTGDGSIAVGSCDGKVRLYSSKAMRQAKTAFPTLGAPITHIDATYDGHWVLGTSDKYLVLINTMWKDEKSGGAKSAFAARAGGKTAAPRILKILPEHLAIAGPDYKFEKACFSWVTESGKTERHIVATVKNFSVIWDMRVVKQDHACYQQSVGFKTCTCYTVRELDESVVDSKFMNDAFMSLSLSDAPLVVATPHKISSLQFQD